MSSRSSLAPFRSKKPIAIFRLNSAGSMQVAMEVQACGNEGYVKGFGSSSAPIISRNQSHFKQPNLKMRGQLCLLGPKLSSVSLSLYSRSADIQNRFQRPYYHPCACPIFGCHFSEERNFKFSMKSNSSPEKYSTYRVSVSYIMPLFLLAGAMLISRRLDLVAPSTEAGKSVMLLLNFVISMSRGLVLNNFASSIRSQTRKFKETNDSVDIRNTVVQFVGTFVYYLLRVLAAMSFVGFFGFQASKFDTSNVMQLCCWTFVLDAISLPKEVDKSTLTSEASRNDDSAFMDKIRASLISLRSMSKQHKGDTARQTSSTILSEDEEESLRARLAEAAEQVAYRLGIDLSCGRSHFTEARSTASTDLVAEPSEAVISVGKTLEQPIMSPRSVHEEDQFEQIRSTLCHVESSQNRLRTAQDLSIHTIETLKNRDQSDIKFLSQQVTHLFADLKHSTESSQAMSSNLSAKMDANHDNLASKMDKLSSQMSSVVTVLQQLTSSSDFGIDKKEEEQTK